MSWHGMSRACKAILAYRKKKPGSEVICGRENRPTA
jgi:hypothetical protein